MTNVGRDVSSSDGPSPVGRRTRRVAIGVIAALSVALAAAAYVGAALYTDRPQFCVSCHEMQPYYDAWSKGTHKGSWCVDCHVGSSYAARLTHKFAVLGEVVVHFTGTPEFPLSTSPRVPDSHCLPCHAKITKKLAKGFDHAEHAGKTACQSCHPDDGHVVTRAALDAAGVLDPNIVRPAFGTPIAVVGHGSANVPGHVSVMCTRCHDLKKTGCEACHDAPSGKHPKSPTTCESCHGAGPKWLFAHSGISQDCKPCHALPAKHFRPVTASLEPCSACHVQPGTSWKARHPGSSADCRSCHEPPAKHMSGQCSECHHNTGVNFAYRHPSTEAPHGIGKRKCVKCHPNGYSTYSCTCHGGGRGEGGGGGRD